MGEENQLVQLLTDGCPRVCTRCNTSNSHHADTTGHAPVHTAAAGGREGLVIYRFHCNIALNPGSYRVNTALNPGGYRVNIAVLYAFVAMLPVAPLNYACILRIDPCEPS